MKYLHEALVSFDEFQRILHTMRYTDAIEKYMTVDRVGEQWIKDNNLIAKVPIKAIRSIKPFRGSYYYPNETMIVKFHKPYHVYNNGIRMTSNDLVSMIHRKKKFQMLDIHRKRRYLYVKLSEE
jgi:predicted small secreted protein